MDAPIQSLHQQLQAILGDSVVRTADLFSEPPAPTFGMRGRGAPLPPEITMDTVSKAFMAYLVESGRMPEGFHFNTSAVTLLKGAFLQRLSAVDPIDTSFYSAMFHGKYRRDIAWLFQQSVDGKFVLDRNPQTASIVRLYLA